MSTDFDWPKTAPINWLTNTKIISYSWSCSVHLRRCHFKLVYTSVYRVLRKCMFVVWFVPNVLDSLQFNNRNQLVFNSDDAQNKEEIFRTHFGVSIVISFSVVSIIFFLSSHHIAFRYDEPLSFKRIALRSSAVHKIYFVSNFIMKNKETTLIKLANHTDASPAN